MTTICKNDNFHIYLNDEEKIFFVEIYDPKYNKENFILGMEYIKNFWILIGNTDDKYDQVFICNNVEVYPLEIYDTFIKLLRSLEEIFKKNLHSSCLVNNSDAMNIFRPILNVYKAVRPFSFVNSLENGIKFVKNNPNY